MKRESIKKSRVSMLACAAIIGVCSLTALAPRVTSATQVTETGHYQEGWNLNSKDHKWYYLKDHVNVKGWLELDGNWFYLDEQGAMVNDTTLKIDGVEYTFSRSGKCTNTPVK
jgi:hypothetical protein